MTADLQACPFCNGRAAVENYIVEACAKCSSCGATITRRHAPEWDSGVPAVVAAWNTRLPPTSAEPDVRAERVGERSVHAEPPSSLTHPETPESADGWHTFDTQPDVGRKFVALFNDGSGARMYWRYDHGFINEDGDDFDAADIDWSTTYERWAYLPDGFEFWCENSPEPMTLQLPPASTPAQRSERSDDEGGLRDEPIQNPKPEGAS